MARIIIADAGPLIAFAGIDALHVLQKLFSEINIAQVVKHECLVKPGTDSQRIELAINAGWIKIVTPTVATGLISPALGAGESESICFAMESPDESLLIVDDRLARRFALKQGINIVGTVRILYFAEQRGLIRSAKQTIVEMSAIGYRISVELLNKLNQGQVR